MHALTADAYPRVVPLFSAMTFHLPLVAALAGSAPAVVWADDALCPTVALIGVGHRFYLAGPDPNADAAAAVGRLFAETLTPAAQVHGGGWFSVCASSDGWGALLPGCLPDPEPIAARRQYYVWREDGRPAPAVPPLPDGFSVRLADRALLGETGLGNLAALEEEMCSERPSVEAFLTHSFGLAPLYNDQIAGWCLSEYNTGDRCEVGIAALEPYRRRGLATAVGSAFVALAQARGVRQIGWHCYARNSASGATARKIGLAWVMDYGATVARYV